MANPPWVVLLAFIRSSWTSFLALFFLWYLSTTLSSASFYTVRIDYQYYNMYYYY